MYEFLGNISSHQVIHISLAILSSEITFCRHFNVYYVKGVSQSRHVRGYIRKNANLEIFALKSSRLQCIRFSVRSAVVI